jgi:hypothetical protein
LSLNAAGNRPGSGWDGSTDGSQALSNALKGNTTLEELNVSSNDLQADDARIRADGIIDNGALSVTNVMGNRIPKEQLVKLQEIMRSKPNLVSLCGIADGATEVIYLLSGLGMDAGGAAILTSELLDKRALSVLCLKSNRLATKEGGEALAQALANNSALKELDVSSSLR